MSEAIQMIQHRKYIWILWILVVDDQFDRVRNDQAGWMQMLASYDEY